MTPEVHPWPSGAVLDERGLSIAGATAVTLASSFDTPLLVFDEADFRARCFAFATAFPRAFYAVKAFTERQIIQIAREEGLGLLASTGGELGACLRAGAEPASIALHGNNKSDTEMEDAVRAGVGFVMVDNIGELERLDVIARAARGRQPVLLRINPEISVETHDYLDTGSLEAKFGTPIGGGQALAFIERAISLEAVTFLGLHAHVGSQLFGSEPYLAEIDALVELMAEAKLAFGAQVRMLDLGGGFGVTYVDEAPMSLAGLATEMLERVSAATASRGLAMPEIVVEPGRALIANAGLTLYRVGSVKTLSTGRVLVAVDGGMSDNIRPALYGAKHTVALASPPRLGTALASVTVVGKHCESGDVLAEHVALPEDVHPGDLVAFAATGAYTYSMASNYNRVGRPAVAMVRQGQAHLLLRREDDAEIERLEAAPVGEPRVTLPDGVQVRPARSKDARSFAPMWAAVVAEGSVHSQQVRDPVKHYKLLFKSSWTPRGAWILAVQADEVIGLLSVARGAEARSEHVGTIGIGIAEAWRSKGVGTALMAEAFRWARAHDVHRLVLSVYPDNARALALYRKFGFTEEGRLVRHISKPVGYVDEILMARWLE